MIKRRVSLTQNVTSMNMVTMTSLATQNLHSQPPQTRDQQAEMRGGRTCMPVVAAAYSLGKRADQRVGRPSYQSPETSYSLQHASLYCMSYKNGSVQRGQDGVITCQARTCPVCDPCCSRPTGGHGIWQNYPLGTLPTGRPHCQTMLGEP